MRVTLELTGTELVLLYISTGNESAGALIRQCIAEQREFEGPMKAMAMSVTRRPKLDVDAKPSGGPNGLPHKAKVQ